ncbi:hypothetical protein BDW71DRAFT_207704 [Aspergillus fruticulosus]
MDGRHTDRRVSHGGVLLGYRHFMELICYHYIIGSVTAHPISDDSILSPSWRRILRPSGASNNLLPLDLIARIAALRSEAAVTPSGQIIAQAVAIWKDLDGWEPRVPGETEISSAYHILAHSYTSACFIWLFLILYPDNIDDEKVQVVVSKCLEHLSSITTVGLQAFLLFPIFVVGIACTRQGSLPFIGLIVGEFAGGIYTLVDAKRYMRKLRANNDIPIPEWRLLPAIVGGVAFIIGLFCAASVFAANTILR